MSPVTNITAAASSSSACDAWITAPLTTSCGVGVCSNATGFPTCVCSPGWSGVGDYDFRSLPLQDADCDKYPDFFRACYFLAAAVSFVNMFCCMYMYKMARSKKGRKKTTAMLFTIVPFYACVLWGFRGIEPKRSIGVDPAITILFAGYTLIWWSAATYVMTTSTYSGRTIGERLRGEFKCGKVGEEERLLCYRYMIYQPQ